MTKNSNTTKSAAANAAYEDALAAGKETVEQAVKATTEAATKGYENFLNMGQNGADSAAQNYDQYTSFGKDTVEALMQAGSVAAKGVEAINAEMLSFTKAQVEESVAATRSFTTAKTLQDAFQMQADFARKSFDAYVSGSARLGEIVVKTTQDAAGPMNSRYAQLMETFIAR